MKQLDIKIKRDPEEKTLGNPIWWHNHGGKCKASRHNKVERSVTIAGSAAHLFVSRAKNGWSLTWAITHGYPLNEAGGHITLRDDEMFAAFGFSELTGNFGDWLIRRYGGDSAEQGKYIRWGRYLNIPGPGTGNDGDANMSIYVSDDIRDAIRKLVRTQ